MSERTYMRFQKTMNFFALLLLAIFLVGVIGSRLF